VEPVKKTHEIILTEDGPSEIIIVLTSSNGGTNLFVLRHDGQRHM